MPSTLILSSHVAASRVGGTVQAMALAAFGIDPVHVPTVLFGRHPGWGPPGGAATAEATFEGMLEGIAAQGVMATFDLVITGYFASAAQVRTAARAIEAVRTSAPSPLILVDPVMGDFGKALYVKPEVADAVARELVPRADLISPNAWELQRLTGREGLGDPAAAVAAARTLGKPALVSSVRQGDRIGAVYADRDQAWLALHPAHAQVPSGAGDLLAALFAAHRLGGRDPGDALHLAVEGVEAAVAAAKGGDLAVVALGPALKGGSGAAALQRLD